MELIVLIVFVEDLIDKRGLVCYKNHLIFVGRVSEECSPSVFTSSPTLTGERSSPPLMGEMSSST